MATEWNVLFVRSLFLLLFSLLIVPCDGKLYNISDHMILLENDTISNTIHASPVSWIVEFYSSWCGHCHAFAPTWKRMATKVKDWAQVIRVGALDCAEERNLDTCRHFNVQAYPTVKFFNASSSIDDIGQEMKEEKSLSNLIKGMVHWVDLQIKLQKIKVKPDFVPVRQTDINKFHSKGSPHNYLALVFEKPSSVVGKMLVLDTMKFKALSVKRVHPNQLDIVKKYGFKEVELPYAVFIRPNGSRRLVTDVQPKLNRTMHDVILEELHKLDLRATTYEIPTVISSAITNYTRRHPTVKKDQPIGKVNRSEVYMQDMLSALSVLWRREVYSHEYIRGVEWKVLSDFTHLLIQCFPGPPEVVRFIEHLRDKFFLPDHGVRKVVHSKDIVRYMDKLHPPIPTNVAWKDWRGCHGSKPKFRGYPCGLWTMFHTMTVNCARLGDRANIKPKEILPIIRDYIRNFFGCRECAGHFYNMTKNVENEVKTFDDAVLFLWKGHNKANARLAGDPSEDPSSLKVQFPPPELCPNCRKHDWRDGKHAPEHWNMEMVLNFLKGHYGPNNIRIKDEKAEQQEDQLLFDDVRNRSSLRSIGMNRLDTSMCLVLYSAIALCILALYLYFLRRRRRMVKVRLHEP